MSGVGAPTAAPELPRIAAIIPAFNEAERIADTIRAVSALPEVSEVIVVDDGSSDDTYPLAVSAGAHRVISLPHNRGKGAALNAALAECSAPVLLLLDADLGRSAGAAQLLLAPVLAEVAEITIARFTTSGSGGGAGLAVGLARWAVRKLGGTAIHSPLSGQRCMKRSVVEALGGFETGFAVETAMTIDALRHGYTILEVEVPMTHRVTGRKPAEVAHRARQFRDILWVVARRSLMWKGSGRPPAADDR